jgi:hypothetical protein
MVPYRGVRYHLKEQRLASQKYYSPIVLTYYYYTNSYTRPENAKELFNLRHSSLRNAIERTFGVLKRKFKILRTAPEYSIETQIDIILALTALFNFTPIHGVTVSELLKTAALVAVFRCQLTGFFVVPHPISYARRTVFTTPQYDHPS